MIETTIQFILSLITLFVKFLGDININLFGYSFSFYSFILASIIILVFASGLIAVIKRAGSSYVSAVSRASKYSKESNSSEPTTSKNRGL